MLRDSKITYSLNKLQSVENKTIEVLHIFDAT